jgi:hypothetical protein
MCKGVRIQQNTIATAGSIFASAVEIGHIEKAVNIYSRRGAVDAKKEE